MSEQDEDLLTGGISDEQPAEDTGNQDPAGPGESAVTPVEDGSKDRPGWMDQLSGDLKDSEALRKFKSTSDVAKSYIELEGKLGKAVTISEEPTEEELSRVRTLLGVPESEEGYDFSDIELPKGYSLAEGAIKDVAKFAKTNDLTVGQAKAVIKRIAEREHEAVRQVRQIVKEGREKAEARLRSDLGEGYDKHLKAANTVLATYGDKELMSSLKDSGFVNSPALTRFLGKVGLAVSESEAPRGGVKPVIPVKPTGFPVAAALAEKRKGLYDS